MEPISPKNKRHPRMQVALCYFKGFWNRKKHFKYVEPGWVHQLTERDYRDKPLRPQSDRAQSLSQSKRRLSEDFEPK